MQGKVPVEVLAKHGLAGGVTPLVIKLEDGRKFPVDRVLDVRPAASLKAGGAGIRYTCRISGRERYLFLDDGCWFVENAISGGHT